MTREELIALRDAIDLTLALPDSLRELMAQWLAPAAAKPNGHDHNPPAPMSTPRMVKVRAKRIRKPPPAQVAERKLLAAMRDNPGLSVIALANVAGSSRTATGERLRQMAMRGVVEKDLTGRWKVKSGGAAIGGRGPGPYDRVAELEATPEPKLPELQPRPAPWVRNVNDYTRQITSEFQGNRYG